MLTSVALCNWQRFVWRIFSGITQESKSAIKCWCYEQHQHCNNSCNGTVSHGAVISQHADELCEFSASLRPGFARYLATRPLSEGALVSTALGIFVAIPAVVAFNHFTGKIETFHVEMNRASTQLVNCLFKIPETKMPELKLSGVRVSDVNVPEVVHATR